MKFKEEIFKDQWWNTPPKLRMIACDMEWYVLKNFKIELEITSIFRPKTTDSGIHSCFRAIDFSSHGFSPEQIEEVYNYVNDKYPYGKGELKTLIHHDVGQGPHFHLQISQ